MTKWMTKSLAVVGAIVAVAGASNAQIINGGFEGGLAPWVPGGFGTVPGNGGVLNDSFSISGNYYWLNEGPGPQVGVSQTLSILSPTNLSISGQYATRVLGSGTNSFLVRVLDASNDSVLHQATFNPTGVGNWTNFSVTTGVINVPNIRVAFISQVGFDDDYMIDNITANSTPEPGAVALLALALVPGVAVLRRRK